MIKNSAYAVFLCAFALLFCAPSASKSDPRVSAKTPDGIGYLIPADDLSLSPNPQPVPQGTGSRPDPAFVKELLDTIDQSLTYLSEKSSPTDPEYYDSGAWYSPNYAQPGDWVYNAGPAGLAAELWQYRNLHPDTMDAAAKARQPWLRQVALDTFERQLKEHQKPDGDFSDIANSHRDFFTIDFITTYLILKDTMDPDMKQRWLDDMRSEVNFMMKSGDLPNPVLQGWKATDGWYVNGNVELSESEWLYLVWQATGEQKYKDLYELQWKHTLSPFQLRWKGYGEFYFKDPSKADASDASGFVSEAAAAPGFDKEYGLLQSSIAARLFVKTHDLRVLRTVNTIVNGLMPHLDQSTMILDALYGSRHSTLPLFDTCAPEVLVWLGGRSDLEPMLKPHLEKALQPFMLDNARRSDGNPGVYRAYGFDLGAILEAVMAAENQ